MKYQFLNGPLFIIRAEFLNVGRCKFVEYNYKIPSEKHCLKYFLRYNILCFGKKEKAAKSKDFISW